MRFSSPVTLVGNESRARLPLSGGQASSSVSSRQFKLFPLEDLLFFLNEKKKAGRKLNILYP